MGGYQLMVSADIFRGRYRESLETPKALAPNEPLLYRFALPTANHVFLPGHRIMVQVQSSWFPLYDRNPQTLRAQHLLGEAGGLPEGRAADLPRARPGELRRAAARHDALTLEPPAGRKGSAPCAGQLGVWRPSPEGRRLGIAGHGRVTLS